MKPKNKFQKQVFELSQKLPKISHRQRRWAIESCIKYYGKRTAKGVITCLNCAHSWQGGSELGDALLGTECPRCAVKLEVMNTRKFLFKQSAYFCLVTTKEDFQVLRYFSLKADYKAGEKAHYSISEVVQRWIAPSGKHAVIARARPMSYYDDVWNFYSNLEIRLEKSHHTVSYSHVYPHQRFIPELKRAGYKGDNFGIGHFTLFKTLLSDSRAETLLKAGQTEVLSYFSGDSIKYLAYYWRSIKICMRNSYKINDAEVWKDYLDLLRLYGKDLHNAKYVCPNDLTAELVSGDIGGVMIGGTRWATRNVNTFGVFVDSPADFGRQYQWSGNPANWDTSWSLYGRVSIPAGRTMQNADGLAGGHWNNGAGPCPVGWRLPTNVELSQLLTHSTRRVVIWSSNTTVTGNVIAGTGASIFLPIRSNFNEDGYPIGINNAGYWTGTIVQANPVQVWLRGWGNDNTTGLMANNLSGMEVGLPRHVNGLIRCVQDDIPATGITVTPVHMDAVPAAGTIVSMFIGTSGTLTAAVVPTNTTDQNVIWHSTNTAAATVAADGVVTAHAPGTTTITASAGGVTSYQFTVTVLAIDGGVSIAGTTWATRNVNTWRNFVDHPTNVGMLYQWNRQVAWNATTPSGTPGGWDTTAPAGTSWYAGNDPCPTGWRVPTQAQLMALRNTTAPNHWRAVWSESGITNGGTFGTDENFIFLPAVAWRNSGGTLQAVGSTIGHYWSSTQSDGGGAMSLWFGRGGGTVNSTYRSVGFSVRCVQEVVVPATGITVTPVHLTAVPAAGTAVNMFIGTSGTLTAAVVPANATAPVTWNSTNTAVATVSGSGLTATVNALTVGTTTITASAGEVTSHQFTVTVLAVDDGNEGVLIEGTRWATRNLDTPGNLVAHPAYHGRFYQWGVRNNAIHHFDNTPGIPSDWNSSHSRTAWTTTHNPCPPGWRVPDEAEFVALRNTTHPNHWRAVWSESGITHGGIFGTDENFIFLPAAGSRNTAGSLINAGNSGRYWSNSTIEANITALLLWFNNNNSSTTGFDNRANAKSLRCVQE